MGQAAHLSTCAGLATQGALGGLFAFFSPQSEGVQAASTTWGPLPEFGPTRSANFGEVRAARVYTVGYRSDLLFLCRQSALQIWPATPEILVRAVAMRRG